MTVVGVPTEIKPDEYRVAITPIGVRELSEHGHDGNGLRRCSRRASRAVRFALRAKC